MKNLLYDLSVPAHAAGLENSDASERRFDRRLDIGLLCLVAAEWLLLALLVGLMPDVWSGSALRGSLQLAITGFAGALLVGASALSVCGVRPAFEPNRVLTLSQVAACSWFLVLNGAGDLCWVAVLLSLVTVSLYRDWRLSATAAAALSAAILVVRGQQLSAAGAQILGLAVAAAGLAVLGSRCRRSAKQLASTRASLQQMRAQCAREVADAARDLESKVAQAWRDCHARTELVANMGHNLRTPLIGVRDLAEQALHGVLPPDLRARLEMMQGSAVSLVSIIDDLVAVADPEAGEDRCEPQPCDVRDLVADVLQLFALAAAQNGIELSGCVRPDVPHVVMLPAGPLRRVLMDLLGTALEGAVGGQVSMLLSAERLESNSVLLQFVTSADSTEACSEALGLVLDAEADDPMAATGLPGLRVAERTAQQLGAELTCSGVPGDGLSLVLHVPCQVQAVQDDSTQSRARLLEGLRVLIVDGCPTSSTNLRDIVASWRMVPHVATTAEAAVRAIQEAHERCQPFALVLLDAHLSESDGFALARKISELRRSGRSDAPVVMLSSGGPAVQAESPEEYGVERCILKPVRQSSLMRTLVDVVQLAMFGSQGRVDRVGELRQFYLTPPRPLRVVVAEDNLVNQQLALRVLSRHGHDVLLADNGQVAVDLVAQDRVDVVLMDLQMPVMDGLQASTAIRRLPPDSGGQVPIVALTVCDSESDRRRCAEAGMQAFVAKPFRTEQLLHVLAEVVTDGTAIEQISADAEVAEPDSTGPALNREALLSRVGYDVEFLDMMAVMFREDCPRRLDELHTALAAGDAAQVRVAAHSLRGSAGNIGADRAATLASQLQHLAESRDLNGCAMAVVSLEQALDTAFIQLDELIAELQGAEA